MGMKTSFLIMVALLIVAAPAPGIGAAFATDFAGHWEGAIQIPGMDPGLTVKVDLKQDAGAWSGTIDIPMQSAKGIALERITALGDSVRFSIAGVPGDPTFAGRFENGAIAGDFTQGGQKFPFTLGRENVVEITRPQEPKLPLPYRAEEVTFPNGDITLAGTLTMPEDGGPFAAVVLVTGSGPEDRDEAVFSHRPFLVLSDHLTRSGIAVLRYDDRGFGKSTGNFATATTEDFAEDALAAVRYLKGREEIAGDRIGILGHSEGGLIAPLAAIESKDVAFVVMLAGPGVPGSEILPAQVGKIVLASGGSKEKAEKQTAVMKRIVKLVETEPDSLKLHDGAMALAREQVALMSDEERMQLGDNPDATLERQISALTSPWFRFFLSYDPRPTLAKVQVPVLALNGSLDTQVPPEQNLPEIEKALKKGGNKDFVVRELPGLNHLFQKATTGGPDEYFNIAETMNPAALDAVSEWIGTRFVTR
jgi:fermentation-respiration switch protein FrsA (DUF1100 family)